MVEFEAVGTAALFDGDCPINLSTASVPRKHMSELSRHYRPMGAVWASYWALRDGMDSLGRCYGQLFGSVLDAGLDAVQRTEPLVPSSLNR